MNLLPFVVCLLMLLTCLTYGRLQHVIADKAVMKALLPFFEVQERQSLHKGSLAKYDTVKINVQAREGRNDDAIRAHKGVNWSVFFKEPGDRDEAQFTFSKMLSKRLIDELFDDYPYITALQERRPGAVDELIDSLAGHSAATVKDIDRVQLSDPDLNELLYHLCKSTKFQDLISMSKHKTIRLWLAKEKVLVQLFGQAGATAVMEERRKLYNLTKRQNDGISSQEASTRFKTFVEGLSSPYMAFFNTEASGTRPENDTQMNSKTNF